MIADVRLSKREQEVLKLVLQGKSNKQIAWSLGISVPTVEFHLKNIYARFEVSSRVELILKLGQATGVPRMRELGYSTVDRREGNIENRGGSSPQMDWPTFRGAVTIIGKELIMKAILKNPAAFLPLVMSFSAFATVVIYVAMFGTARQADENAAAHIWQLLMACQVPIIAFFALTWLPRSPKQALLVLALQGSAAMMALAPVYLLRF